MTSESLYDIIGIVKNYQLSNAAGSRAPGGVLLLEKLHNRRRAPALRLFH